MTNVIKLPKAPLQEAIFEIRWELEIDPTTNQTFDMGYSLAQGKLQEIIKEVFPVHKRKVPHSEAHNITSVLFKELTKSGFYASFQ